MLDWNVADQEEPPPPPVAEGDQPDQPVPRRWGTLVAVALLLLLLPLVLGGWQLFRQQRLLREQIQEVVLLETRAWTVGAAEQAEDLADPDAAFGWRHAYVNHFQIPRDVPGTPRVLSVELQKEGTFALVELEWPRPAGPLAPTWEPTRERRAYRLIDGQWQRTARPLDRTERLTHETEHFVVEAPPDVTTRFAQGQLLDLEALYDYVVGLWPAGSTRPPSPPLRIVIQPYEFEPQVRPLSAINSPDTIFANAPGLAPVVLDSALSAESQYRLVLAHAIVARIAADFPVGPGISPELGQRRYGTFSELAYQLRTATTRQWALTDGERMALRNQWRRELGDEWHSPFRGPMLGWRAHSWAISRDLDPLAFDAPEARRSLALSLLLEQMIERHGEEIIPRLAERLATVSEEERLATLFLEIHGGTLEELEAEALDYAMTMEP